MGRHKKHLVEGVKYDEEKPRWDLLPLEEMESVVMVLTKGAQTYDDDNWKKVPNAKRRYYAAVLRHMKDYQKGEYLDKDDGEPHLAHAICDLIFLLWFNNQERNKADIEELFQKDRERMNLQ